MTQTETPHPEHGHLIPETFAAVVYRRSRYALAITLSAWLFCSLGWYAAAPPAQQGGISLAVWGGGVQGLLNGVLLTAMLLVATAVCSLLIHPDSPHMGLFCALLGLAGLSIRGGTVQEIIRFAQDSPDHYRAVAQMLGVECLQWGVMFTIAELFARWLHDKFFANTHWITRTGTDMATSFVARTHEGKGVMGVALSVSRALQTDRIPRSVGTPLAVVVSGALSMLLLFLLMQSQLKGQVLFACFVAFYGATLGTYLLFPRVPALAFLAVVPLTAAAGCFYASQSGEWPLGKPGFYPGQAHFFMMRALPIDYIAAGVPGAILGYYGAFWWSVHSHEE